MTSDQAQQTIVFAQRLWPEWAPDDADLESWGRVFERTVRPEDAKAALVRLKDASSYKSPNRKDYAGLLAAQGGKVGTRPASADECTCGMWILCVEPPEDRPGLLGHFLTLYWPSDDAMPDPDGCQRAIEAFRVECEITYGGRWQLIRAFQAPVSDLDMMRRRAELRAQHSQGQYAQAGPMSAAMGRTMAAIARNLEKAQAHPPASR